MSYCLVYKCRFPSTHATCSHQCGKCHQIGHGQNECGDLSKIIKLKTHANYKIELPVNIQCNTQDCMYKEYHTTESHTSHNVKIKCPLCDTTSTISSTQKKCLNQTNKCAICQETIVEIYLPNCGHICLCTVCSKTLWRDNDTYKNQEPFDLNIVLEKDFDKSNLDITNMRKMIDHIDGKIYFIVQLGMGCCYYVKRDSKNSLLTAYFMHSDNWGQYGPDTDDRDKLNKFIAGYKQITPSMT